MQVNSHMTNLEMTLLKALKDLTEIVECQPSYDGFEEELDAANDAIYQAQQQTITEAAESAVPYRPGGADPGTITILTGNNGE